MRIPIIDIAPFRSGGPAAQRAVATEIGEACASNGFFLITGHGFDPTLLADCYAAAREFFELPADEKAKLAPPSRDVFRGYFGREVRRTAAYREKVEHGDLKEEFLVGPIDARPDLPVPPSPDRPGIVAWCEQANVWPERPSAFRDCFSRFYGSMEALSVVVNRIFAVALGLPEDYFATRTGHHASTANWGYYPAQETPPKPGQIRQGAHTDIGSFTILSADRAPGGLQVRAPDGSWIDVRIPDGAFAINLGDLMERWTNERWRATMHRVVNPPEAERGSVRQSMGYFHKPNMDLEVSCLPTCLAAGEAPKFPPILALDHYRYRMLASRRNMPQVAA